jgi:endo-1,4-beta-xylanase
VQGLNATAMRAEMQEHITAVAGRYANNAQLTSWDVVNEAIGDGTGQLRSSFWFNTLGESYIADAFRFARAVEPNAQLCINDYGTDGMNQKSNALFALVQRLLQANVPITCVGFQAHLQINAIPGDFQQNLQRFANLGLTVRITELDIRIPLPSDNQEFQTQANNFRTVVNACRAVTACQGITQWGIDDDSSWLPNSCCGNEGDPLMWNAQFQPKPAYTAVHDALAAGGPTQTTSNPQVPGAPGAPAATVITQNSINISWTPASGTVTNYQVERATGATSTAFALVQTTTGTAHSSTGLAANTTYRFRVRATNAAGNGPYSAITNITTGTTQTTTTTTTTTTTSTQTNPVGGCTATYAQQGPNWPGGFQGGVTVTNTGSNSTTGWTVTITFSAGQRITQIWSGSTNVNGNSPYAVTNVGYNAVIPPSGSTTFGFLASWNNSSNPAPTVTCSRTP